MSSTAGKLRISYTIHESSLILYKSYSFLEFDMEEIKVKYFTDDIDELCYVEGSTRRRP